MPDKGCMAPWIPATRLECLGANITKEKCSSKGVVSHCWRPHACLDTMQKHARSNHFSAKEPLVQGAPILNNGKIRLQKRHLCNPCWPQLAPDRSGSIYVTWYIRGTKGYQKDVGQLWGMLAPRVARNSQIDQNCSSLPQLGRSARK